jgi:hypothetical protein
MASLASCSIPPVDTTYISSTPADARSFAVAQRAVRACTNMLDRERVLNQFRRSGFKVQRQQIELRRGRTTERAIITAPDPRVSVLYGGGRCYVGLENMTPEQSSQLAKIWVKSYGAEPNSAYGDGLSDHVSGAWRRFFTEPARFPDKAPYYHRIYIAAYKTWPSGPYDPQRNIAYSVAGIFPDKPGAAVKLAHAVECKPIVKTGPRSGAFLPCSGPEFRAR